LDTPGGKVSELVLVSQSIDSNTQLNRFPTKEREFYILLTVRLGTILVNNQLDALFLMYLFISTASVV
jgi:hypothetical protein